MMWETWKDKFFLKLEASRDSETLRTYSKRLRLFENFWKEEHISSLPDPQTLTEEDLLKFLRWMKRKGYDQNYISRSYGDVVRFLEFCRNPNTYYMKLNTPKRVRKLHKYYKDEELKELLNLFSEDNIISFQNKVYIWILAYTGMRSAEAGRLTWEDVDFDSEEISIREDVAKQGIARTVMMPKELKELLQRYKNAYDKYMEFRKVMGKNTLNSLFFKLKNNDVIEPLDKRARTIYNRIYHYLKKNNPELLKSFGLHKFRHTYIREWVKARARIEAVARQVGHQNLETTRKYYAEYDLDFVRDEYEKVKSKIKNKEGDSGE